MPIIDGYNEYETQGGGGFKNFTPGKHVARIVKAEFETGEKDFEPNDALVLALEGTRGETARVWVRIPRDSQQWASWNPKPGKKAGLRDVVKQQLRALGVPMETVETDETRGALIGREVMIEAKQNGQYMNINFQEGDARDGVQLPEPEQVTTGEARPATGMPATAVVV